MCIKLNKIDFLFYSLSLMFKSIIKKHGVKPGDAVKCPASSFSLILHWGIWGGAFHCIPRIDPMFFMSRLDFSRSRHKNSDRDEIETRSRRDRDEIEKTKLSSLA